MTLLYSAINFFRRFSQAFDLITVETAAVLRIVSDILDAFDRGDFVALALL